MAMIGKDAADAPPRQEVGARDRQGDEPVAQHGSASSCEATESRSSAEVPARARCRPS